MQAKALLWFESSTLMLVKKTKANNLYKLKEINKQWYCYLSADIQHFLFCSILRSFFLLLSVAHAFALQILIPPFPANPSAWHTHLLLLFAIDFFVPIGKKRIKNWTRKFPPKLRRSTKNMTNLPPKRLKTPKCLSNSRKRGKKSKRNLTKNCKNSKSRKKLCKMTSKLWRFSKRSIKINLSLGIQRLLVN